MAAPIDPSVTRDFLRSVSLFSSLSDAELGQLVGISRSVVARKGARVFEEGAPADSCWVLMSGRARIAISGADAEIVVGILRPKGVVGELALLDRSTRSASLVALESCRFVVVPYTSFEALRQNPQFEAKLVAHVVRTLRDIHGLIRAMSTPSALSRLAWCLLRLARDEGERSGTSVVIARRTHQDLSEMIGCSRETVSRKLEVLKRRKCIWWDHDSMRLDLAGLDRHVRSGVETRAP